MDFIIAGTSDMPPSIANLVDSLSQQGQDEARFCAQLERVGRDLDTEEGLVDLAHWLQILQRVDKILCDHVKNIARLGASDLHTDPASCESIKLCLRFLVSLLRNASEKKLFYSFDALYEVLGAFDGDLVCHALEVLFTFAIPSIAISASEDRDIDVEVEGRIVKRVVNIFEGLGMNEPEARPTAYLGRRSQEPDPRICPQHLVLEYPCSDAGAIGGSKAVRVSLDRNEAQAAFPNLQDLFNKICMENNLPSDFHLPLLCTLRALGSKTWAQRQAAVRMRLMCVFIFAHGSVSDDQMAYLLGRETGMAHDVPILADPVEAASVCDVSFGVSVIALECIIGMVTSQVRSLGGGAMGLALSGQLGLDDVNQNGLLYSILNHSCTLVSTGHQQIPETFEQDGLARYTVSNQVAWSKQAFRFARLSVELVAATAFMNITSSSDLVNGSVHSLVWAIARACVPSSVLELQLSADKSLESQGHKDKIWTLAHALQVLETVYAQSLGQNGGGSGSDAHPQTGAAELVTDVLNMLSPVGPTNQLIDEEMMVRLCSPAVTCALQNALSLLVVSMLQDRRPDTLPGAVEAGIQILHQPAFQRLARYALLNPNVVTPGVWSTICQVLARGMMQEPALVTQFIELGIAETFVQAVRCGCMENGADGVTDHILSLVYAFCITQQGRDCMCVGSGELFTKVLNALIVNKHLLPVCEGLPVTASAGIGRALKTLVADFPDTQTHVGGAIRTVLESVCGELNSDVHQYEEEDFGMGNPRMLGLQKLTNLCIMLEAFLGRRSRPQDEFVEMIAEPRILQALVSAYDRTFPPGKQLFSQLTGQSNAHISHFGYFPAAKYINSIVKVVASMCPEKLLPVLFDRIDDKLCEISAAKGAIRETAEAKTPDEIYILHTDTDIRTRRRSRSSSQGQRERDKSVDVMIAGILDSVPDVCVFDPKINAQASNVNHAALWKFATSVLSLGWLCQLTSQTIKPNPRGVPLPSAATGTETDRILANARDTLRRLFAFHKSSLLEVLRFTAREASLQGDSDSAYYGILPAACLTSTNPKPSSTLTPTLRCPTCYVLRVVHTGGAYLRETVELDGSRIVMIAPHGTVIHANQRSVNSADVMRYKTPRGWISEFKRDARKDPIVEILAMYHTASNNNDELHDQPITPQPQVMTLREGFRVAIARMQSPLRHLVEYLSRSVLAPASPVFMRTVNPDDQSSQLAPSGPKIAITLGKVAAGYVKDAIDALGEEAVRCLPPQMGQFLKSLSRPELLSPQERKEPEPHHKPSQRKKSRKKGGRPRALSGEDEDVMPPSLDLSLDISTFSLYFHGVLQTILSPLLEDRRIRVNSLVLLVFAGNGGLTALTHGLAVVFFTALNGLSKSKSNVDADGSSRAVERCALELLPSMLTQMRRLVYKEAFLTSPVTSAAEGKLEEIGGPCSGLFPEDIIEGILLSLGTLVLYVWRDGRARLLPDTCMKPFLELTLDLLKNLVPLERAERNNKSPQASDGPLARLASRFRRLSGDRVASSAGLFDFARRGLTPQPAFEPSAEVLATLEGMGFTAAQARAAAMAVRSNNVPAVTEYILTHDMSAVSETTTLGAGPDTSTQAGVANGQPQAQPIPEPPSNPNPITEDQGVVDVLPIDAGMTGEELDDDLVRALQMSLVQDTLTNIEPPISGPSSAVESSETAVTPVHIDAEATSVAVDVSSATTTNSGGSPMDAGAVANADALSTPLPIRTPVPGEMLSPILTPALPSAATPGSASTATAISATESTLRPLPYAWAALLEGIRLTLCSLHTELGTDYTPALGALETIPGLTSDGPYKSHVAVTSHMIDDLRGMLIHVIPAACVAAAVDAHKHDSLYGPNSREKVAFAILRFITRLASEENRSVSNQIQSQLTEALIQRLKAHAYTPDIYGLAHLTILLSSPTTTPTNTSPPTNSLPSSSTEKTILAEAAEGEEGVAEMLATALDPVNVGSVYPSPPVWLEPVALLLYRLSLTRRKADELVSETKHDSDEEHKGQADFDPISKYFVELEGVAPISTAVQRALADHIFNLLTSMCTRQGDETPNPNPSACQALLMILSNLLANYDVALEFHRKGGIGMLLSLPSTVSCSDVRQLASAIVRHVLEDPLTLQEAMETEINLVLARLRKPPQAGTVAAGEVSDPALRDSVPLSAFLPQVINLAQHDVKVFCRAMKKTCHFRRTNKGTSTTKDQVYVFPALPLHEGQAGTTNEEKKSELEHTTTNTKREGWSVLPQLCTSVIQQHGQQKLYRDSNPIPSPSHNFLLQVADMLHILSDIVLTVPAVSDTVAICPVDLPVKPNGQSFVSYIIREIVPYIADPSPTHDPNPNPSWVVQAAEESQAACRLLVALCSRPGQARKAVLAEVVEALDHSSSLHSTHHRESDLHSVKTIALLCVLLCTAETRHGHDGKGTRRVCLDVIRQFLQLGLTDVLIGCLESLELGGKDLPAMIPSVVTDAVRAVLEPLELLTRPSVVIAIRKGKKGSKKGDEERATTHENDHDELFDLTVGAEVMTTTQPAAVPAEPEVEQDRQPAPEDDLEDENEEDEEEDDEEDDEDDEDDGDDEEEDDDEEDDDEDGDAAGEQEAEELLEELEAPRNMPVDMVLRGAGLTRHAARPTVPGGGFGMLMPSEMAEEMDPDSYLPNMGGHEGNLSNLISALAGLHNDEAAEFLSMLQMSGVDVSASQLRRVSHRIARGAEPRELSTEQETFAHAQSSNPRVGVTSFHDLVGGQGDLGRIATVETFGTHPLLGQSRGPSQRTSRHDVTADPPQTGVATDAFSSSLHMQMHHPLPHSHPNTNRMWMPAPSGMGMGLNRAAGLGLESDASILRELHSRVHGASATSTPPTTTPSLLHQLQELISTNLAEPFPEHERQDAVLNSGHPLLALLQSRLDVPGVTASDVATTSPVSSVTGLTTLAIAAEQAVESAADPVAQAGNYDDMPGLEPYESSSEEQTDETSDPLTVDTALAVDTSHPVDTLQAVPSITPPPEPEPEPFALEFRDEPNFEPHPNHTSDIPADSNPVVDLNAEPDAIRDISVDPNPTLDLSADPNPNPNLEGLEPQPQAPVGLACPPGYDPEVFAALPDFMQQEIIDQFVETNADTRELAEAAGFDPETLAALPENIRQEILEQARREQQQAANQPPADPSRAQDMDNASFLASLTPELRAEVLLQGDPAFMASLPPDMIAEAQVLRERIVHGGDRALPFLGRDEEDDTPHSRPSRAEERPPDAQMEEHRGFMQVERLESDRRLAEPSLLPSALILLYRNNPGVVTGAFLLERLLVNLSSHGPTREALLTVMLKLLEGAPRDETRAVIPRIFKTDVRIPPAFPPLQLLGPRTEQRLRRVDSDADAIVSDPPRPPPIAAIRAMLSTLEHLCSGSALVRYELLKPRTEKPQGATNSLLEGFVGLLRCQQYTNTSPVLDELLRVINTASAPLDNYVEPQKISVVSETKDEASEKEHKDDVPEHKDLASPTHTHTQSHTNSFANTNPLDPSQGRWVRVPSIVLQSVNLRLLCEVLLLPSCSEESFKRVSSIVERLSKLQLNKNPLLTHLSQVVEGLSETISTSLVGSASQMKLKRVASGLRTEETKGDRTPTVTVTRATLQHQQYERLYRTIIILHDLGAFKNEPGMTSSSPVVGGGHGLSLRDLWDALDLFMDELRVGAGMDADSGGVESGTGAPAPQSNVSPLLMKLLPLIEAFYMVAGTEALEARNRSEPTTLASPTSLEPSPLQRVDSIPGASFRRSQSFRPGVQEEESELVRRVVDFSHAHSLLINTIIRSRPSLLEDSLSVLVRHPPLRSCIAFDNKRTYFRAELKKLKNNGRAARRALHLSVRRSHVFEDSFHQLRMRSAAEMRSRLSVTFTGEEGIDAGGLTREWYSVLSREIFNPNYALFTAANDGATFQPNPLSAVNPDHLDYFKFVGRVIGKAINDGQLMDAHFTQSFYKHLLGVAVTHQDMEAIDPTYYRNLKQILDHDLDDLGLDLTFSSEDSQFGKLETVDLIPNGRSIPVTDENKGDYVRLITRHRMTTAIRQQIEAFLEGFHDLITASIISIFTPAELELLVCGLPDVDVNDMKNNTDYHQYRPTDDVINWFWEALRSFTREERAQFLQFVTGTSKVPLEGFAHLRGMRGVQKFSIHRVYNTNSLPSAHTCFNQLDLPQYGSYEELREKLRLAVREGYQGFGFA